MNSDFADASSVTLWSVTLEETYVQEAGDAEWFACLSERVPQPSFFRQSSKFTQLVSVSLVSLLVASSDLQLDQAQASITQSILHNLETWRGIGLKWCGGGG